MNATARAVAASLLVAASILAATLTAAAARAHASRVSADPAENSALSAGPAWVSATFNEPLQTTFAAMTVVGPDAKIWSSGQPQVRGAVVGVAVRPLGPVGRYTVNYRVTSADGHVVSGSWSFSLTVPGGGTPGPPAGAGDTATHGIPVWPFFAGAAVLLACAGLWAVRRRA
jgi:methionine-rich copper-binding protein CopC